MSADLRLIRPDVQAMHAYVVQDAGSMVKLDAMENPYRLSPELQAKLGERLGQVAINRYPGPRIDELKAYFELLPPDLRDASKAVILEQMSTDEAAAYLGIKSATLLTRVHRARTRLRGMIESEHESGKEI
jgi:DNA-directed RNA polymerase specialized sigma24 family protein